MTKTVVAGGKALIPVFALGRAQELCILLDEYWEQMGFTFPIYFAAGAFIARDALHAAFQGSLIFLQRADGARE